MNKETREGMKAKKKNDDDIKFDFQEFLKIYQLEKYGSKKEKEGMNLVPASNPIQPVQKIIETQ